MLQLMAWDQIYQITHILSKITSNLQYIEKCTNLNFDLFIGTNIVNSKGKKEEELANNSAVKKPSRIDK